MKKILMMIAMLMLVSVNAYAGQKLINITEDTIPEDSYRPVAGKEFMVAVKLVDVDTEKPISSQPIIFQTSIGTLSETEVTTNIYGEAITWLTTGTMPDMTHSITASVKDNADIAPITIEVRNIALPLGAPTAETLQNQVKIEAKKIQDIIAEVDIITNEPWSAPAKKLKVWEKGDLLKVQEISPNPNVYIRPLPAPITTPPTINIDIIGYNSLGNTYIIYSKDLVQESRYPYYTDYIDNNRKLVVKKRSYLNEGQSINKMEICYDVYSQIDSIWVVKETRQIFYKGVVMNKYERKSVNTNILVNSGIPDTDFE